MFLGNFFRNAFISSKSSSDNESNVLQKDHVPITPSEFDVSNSFFNRYFGLLNQTIPTENPTTEKTPSSSSIFAKNCDDKNCSKEKYFEFKEKKDFSNEKCADVGEKKSQEKAEDKQKSYLLKDRERDRQKLYEDFEKLHQSIDEEYM